MLTKVKIKNGMLYKYAYLDSTSGLISTTTKDKQRYRIQNEVFDDKDSIADNAKMISLLVTMTSRIYDVLTTEQKTLIPASDRSVIEHTFNMFKDTATRADVQLASEGLGMIDGILSRQAAVGDIVK